MKHSTTPQSLNEAFQAGRMDAVNGSRKNKSNNPPDGRYYVHVTDPKTGKKYKIEYL